MKRLSRVGVLAGLVHLVLLGLTVALILGSTHARWPQYWYLFLALDFPVSLGVAPVSWLVPPAPHGPLADFPNFWWPLAYHGVIGTAWWYIVGWAIARRVVGRGDSQ
ncbi:MAG TPA: hypothetical protein VFB54_11795 [Burkholderiales bacterium]|nr:hypothetical protein [Burkholderiales bacterium]